MSVETVDFLAMVKRLIRRAGERVADADEPELAELVALRAELDRAIDAAAKGQHSIGRSWAEVARGLGTSRQAAHARYAPRD